ncbi:unnamed protein product [Bemisia tabaci]|uniref:N-terminal Ras-GEF domain-containing protein n=1 Tax=Bemisia tabaci TaxID=7038 RepID=A0A9P0F209_BEMTA|nr:unnamed protein product [Bemisia tabaci]
MTETYYSRALVFRDNILISGPLDALIQHLVPTTEYYPERSYVFAFLLSSRLFIRPHELLGQVIALCDAQQKLGDKQVSSKERLAKFIPRLVQLLAQWSETFPYDFRDERVMAHVRAITHRCVSVEAGVRHQVSSLLTNLLHRLTALEKHMPIKCPRKLPKSRRGLISKGFQKMATLDGRDGESVMKPCGQGEVKSRGAARENKTWSYDRALWWWKCATSSQDERHRVYVSVLCRGLVETELRTAGRKMEG